MDIESRLVAADELSPWSATSRRVTGRHGIARCNTMRPDPTQPDGHSVPPSRWTCPLTSLVFNNVAHKPLQKPVEVRGLSRRELFLVGAHARVSAAVRLRLGSAELHASANERPGAPAAFQGHLSAVIQKRFTEGPQKIVKRERLGAKNRAVPQKRDSK